jgi:type IV pilus assembly protein PilB
VTTAVPKFKAAESLKSKLRLSTAEAITETSLPSRPIIKAINIPYIDLSKKVIPKNVLMLIPEHLARRYQIVPVELNEGRLIVAMIDPEDQEALEFIKKKTGLEADLRICTQVDLAHILDQYTGFQAEVAKIVEETSDEVGETVEKAAIEVTEEAPATKIIHSLIKRAVRDKASDIHIEPSEIDVSVRFRIDGVLRKIITLPKDINSAIISRIKILSELKIDEQRLPQDGHFQMIIDRNKVDFRVSTLPTVNGEKVVMRILDKSSGILTLEEIGLEGQDLVWVRDNIHKSHGMTLVSGPTGSGKTTTLYAVLGELMDASVNIVTLEDPVEYRMPGINQSQVHTEIGYTFANGLRTIVRQDPDIIMLGEIRDYETADMAVHAALTGHIVLSTIHTNDAAGTVPRLIDMKIEPFLITSSINLLIAQRLCRKICDNCKQKISLPFEQLEELKKKITLPSNPIFYKGKGCDLCSTSGYKGRVGVFEVIPTTLKIKEMILKRVSSDMIKEAAIQEGMTTMIQDGYKKVAKGITTFEEVLRATKA